jgi:hypothetical protein
MKPTILITVQGGVVTGTFANVESDIVIVDYDNMQDGKYASDGIGIYENNSLGVFLAENPEIANHIKHL